MDFSSPYYARGSVIADKKKTLFTSHEQIDCIRWHQLVHVLTNSLPLHCVIVFNQTVVDNLKFYRTCNLCHVEYIPRASSLYRWKIWTKKKLKGDIIVFIPVCMQTGSGKIHFGDLKRKSLSHCLPMPDISKGEHAWRSN